MIEICSSDNCTGCGACINICPRKCIHMKYDENGEIHPQIDSKSCVKCGLCRSHCPVNNSHKGEQPKHVYAAWRNNRARLLDSASGGVGAALAEAWVNGGGIVYGTKFDKDFEACVCGEETLEGIEGFKGSKYVQSNTGDSYREIKNDLDKGRHVLFFGTPCQIAGLYAIVDRTCVNLTTVEILCHGVSSNQYLKEELKYIEKKYGGLEYDTITFRTNRWMMDFCFCLWKDNQNVFNEPAYENEYFRGFLTGLTLRESCYKCRYKSVYRIGDILIGDFIGFGKHVPFDGKHNRPSLVFAMNEKASNLLNKIETEVEFVERSVDEALIDGRSLKESFPRHNKQKQFRECCKNNGFIDAIHEVMGDEIKQYKKKNRFSDYKRRIKLFIFKMTGIKIQGGKIYHEY